MCATGGRRGVTERRPVGQRESSAKPEALIGQCRSLGKYNRCTGAARCPSTAPRLSVSSIWRRCQPAPPRPFSSISHSTPTPFGQERLPRQRTTNRVVIALWQYQSNPQDNWFDRSMSMKPCRERTPRDDRSPRSPHSRQTTVPLDEPGPPASPEGFSWCPIRWSC